MLLVSTVKRIELAACICICICICSVQLHVYVDSWISFPPAHLTSLGHHRALSGAPCAKQQVPLVSTLPVVVHECQSQSPSSSHPNPDPTASTHLLSVRTANSCPGSRFTCAVFLDSTYVHLRSSNTSVAMSTSSSQTLSFDDTFLLPSDFLFLSPKAHLLVLDKKMGSPKDEFYKVIQPINIKVSPGTPCVTPLIFTYRIIPKLGG